MDPCGIKWRQITAKTLIRTSTKDRLEKTIWTAGMLESNRIWTRSEEWLMFTRQKYNKKLFFHRWNSVGKDS